MEDKQTSTKHANTFLTQNTRELGMLALIIVFGILVNIRSAGNFLTGKNLSDMFVETSILVILTMGMMMVIITGGIDLSVGAIMALSGMVGASVLKAHMDMNPVIIVFISVAVGLVAGFVNGFLIARLNILPIIATLATMNAYRGLTYLVSDGSWILQQNMSKSFMNIATGRLFGINYLIWIAIVVGLVAFCFLGYNRTGRQIYAIGNSMESAEVSGINTKRITVLVYTLVGGLAGLAGVLYVCKYAAAQGETAMGYELNVIAACVLGGISVSGGVGKVQGAVLGAILLGLLNNALPLLQISPFWQDAIRGLIILFSIITYALITRRASKKALERRSMA